MKELSVYNLEFPVYIDTLNISGYKFKRIPNYASAFVGLQHTIKVIGSEFPIEPNTGTHQLTATVEIPSEENSCILPWTKDSKFSKLQDVILFLSLFTGRNVFVLNPGEEKYPLRPDPRGHFWGGQFRLSIRRNTKWRDKITGAIYSDEEMEGKPVYNYEHLDFGLEGTINDILQTIASQKWRDEYDTGYFIFTFRQALRENDIEPAFLLCWTVWEHLFTLHNRKWLDDQGLEQTSGERKIAFILYKYFMADIDNFARVNIKRLVKARNRLIHFGSMSEEIDIEEMQMFIRLTEQIMALVLNLQPSNALNSIDSLQSFLKKK